MTANTTNLINAYIEFACMLVSIFCIVCVCFVQMRSAFFRRWSIVLFSINSLLMFVNAMGNIYEYQTTKIAFFWMEMSIFWGYVLGAAFGTVMALLMANTLLYSVILGDEKKTDGIFKAAVWGTIKPKEKNEFLLVHWKRFASVMFVIEIIAIIANIKYGFIYSISDENVYVSNPNVVFLRLFSVLLVITGCIIAWHFRKQLTETVRDCIGLSLIITLVKWSIMSFYRGVSVSSISNTIIVMIAFIAIQDQVKQKLDRQEKMIADMRINVMNSQIQPHFLFNSLNTIYALCDIDIETAKKAINKFSDYLRTNINSMSSSEPVAFSKELEHVKTYLWLEQLRFGDRVKAEYDIQTENFFVTPLLIQPLVENAIKHGICQKEEGGTVKISTRELDGSIVISIRDDGVGFDEKDLTEDGQLHIGLHNSRERTINNLHGEFVVNSRPGIGTEIRIKLPKNLIAKKQV